MSTNKSMEDVQIGLSDCFEQQVMSQDQITAYLKRIGLHEVSRNYEGLKALQYHHFHSVPYENLDILAKKPVSLALPDLYSKVVERGRGGYCFELNGLFAWLLRSLGFQVTEHLGRFLRGESGMPMGRHRVLRVQCEEDCYICDVGVGSVAPLYPIRLTTEEQRQGNELYRLTRHKLFGNVLEHFHHDEWVKVFSFTEEPAYASDFIAPSFYCEQAGDSIFNKTYMLHIWTKEGRTSFDGTDLKVFTKDGVVVRSLEEKEISGVLKEHFGLAL